MSNSALAGERAQASLSAPSKTHLSWVPVFSTPVRAQENWTYLVVSVSVGAKAAD